MAKNLQALLDQAAQLRSCGASWESVGRKVQRRAATCRSWPRRYPAQWEVLYRQAAETRSAELGNEAESRLRMLLHDEDKRWQIKSAEVLLRHRWRPEPLVGPAPDAVAAVAPPPPPEEPPGTYPIYLREWLYWVCTDYNEWRVDRGLSPTTTIQDLLDESFDFFTFQERCRDDKAFADAFKERKSQRENEQRERKKEASRAGDASARPLLLCVLVLIGMAALALGGERWWSEMRANQGTTIDNQRDAVDAREIEDAGYQSRHSEVERSGETAPIGSLSQLPENALRTAYGRLTAWRTDRPVGSGHPMASAARVGNPIVQSSLLDAPACESLYTDTRSVRAIVEVGGAIH